MPLRQYDPAIARFTSIDPVVHYDYSTFTAFDNNPVFWADPSGADAIETSTGTTYTGADAVAFAEGLQAGLRGKGNSEDDDENGPCGKKPCPEGQTNPNSNLNIPAEAAYAVAGGGVAPKPLRISGGVLSGSRVVNDITSVTERSAMTSIQGIVLHRTVSSTAESAITTTKNNRGRTGFHIVVDTDGTITQVNNFKNRANHVGKATENLDNFNSIGVEVVGQHTGAPGENSWDPLTLQQINRTTSAVNLIMRTYGVSSRNVIPHENTSRKTAGEGGVVKNVITLNPLPKKLPPPINFNIRKARSGIFN